MNHCAWHDKIGDYAAGPLPPGERAATEAHLATCESCRAELASFRALLEETRRLPRDLAPGRDLWSAIEAECAAGFPPTRARLPNYFWFAGFAAAAAVALLLVVRFKKTSPSETNTWSVATLSGTPRVDREDLQGQGRLGVGQWLVTDALSTAKVAVGSIGEVSIEPNSRLRLVGTSATDHRVELARGTMRALIWAPPRLFFVNTPSATAIDLGCAYTLSVDDQGAGLLHVTSGYVALEHDGRESIIPAGFKCETRQRFGPGTPFALDASAELRAALESFDFQAGGAAALREVLKRARADDAITLWHLLGRVEANLRGEVFDALAQFHVAPSGVTRTGIVAGDLEMRNVWARELGFGRFVSR